MNNKIALVNKDLHNKLFEAHAVSEGESPPKIYRENPLPPKSCSKI